MCFSKAIFTLALLLVGHLSVSAQRVTLTPSTGRFIAAYTRDGGGTFEEGFAAGLNSMIKHEQLPLTYVTSDKPEFSTSGHMINHTCDVKPYKRPGETETKIVQIAGYLDVFSCLSLPRGYRFKSYKIVLQNNIDATSPTSKDGK